MTFVVRASREDDLDALYEMAKLTGGGFTNLPPERATLRDKLARSAEAFARDGEGVGDDLFVLVLENARTGQVRGTSQIFSKVGTRWPFYSYRLTSFTKHSRELARTVRAEMLVLTTDLEGSTEVGGLFLHPAERAGGLGLLLARSRYLFIRQHRTLFGDRIIAELRGVIDEAGGSPFWDGLAGKFFAMNFQEADEFNAIHGNQFIADLMPKTPIYTAMLNEGARAVIGLPHPTGRAAMRMLEGEGFTSAGGYVDIFDGGPTMIAETSRVRSVVQAREMLFAGTGEGGVQGLAASGRLGDFRAVLARVAEGDDGAAMDADGAAALGTEPGAPILFVER